MRYTVLVKARGTKKGDDAANERVQRRGPKGVYEGGFRKGAQEARGNQGSDASLGGTRSATGEMDSTESRVWKPDVAAGSAEVLIQAVEKTGKGRENIIQIGFRMFRLRLRRGSERRGTGAARQAEPGAPTCIRPISFEGGSRGASKYHQSKLDQEEEHWNRGSRDFQISNPRGLTTL